MRAGVGVGPTGVGGPLRMWDDGRAAGGSALAVVPAHLMFAVESRHAYHRLPEVVGRILPGPHEGSEKSIHWRVFGRATRHMTSRPALYSILVVNLLRAAATTLLLLLLTSATAQVRLTVAIPEDPGSLDPAAATSTSALLVTNQVYDTLFDISPEGQVEGRLAAEWSYADATRLRVRLVPDVTFSDGAPLDAAAVQASLLRFLALREERPAGALLETVTAVEVQDEHRCIRRDRVELIERR